MEKLLAVTINVNAKISSTFLPMEHMTLSAYANIHINNMIETQKFAKDKIVQNVMVLPVLGLVLAGKNMINIKQFHRHLNKERNKEKV